VLRGLFVPKGDDIMGGWRKLHNEELHNLLDQAKEDEMGMAYSTHGEKDFGGKCRRKEISRIHMQVG
jgi:hypothetical protein